MSTRWRRSGDGRDKRGDDEEFSEWKLHFSNRGSSTVSADISLANTCLPRQLYHWINAGNFVNFESEEKNHLRMDVCSTVVLKMVIPRCYSLHKSVRNGHWLTTSICYWSITTLCLAFKEISEIAPDFVGDIPLLGTLIQWSYKLKYKYKSESKHVSKPSHKHKRNVRSTSKVFSVGSQIRKLAALNPMLFVLYPLLNCIFVTGQS